jgi:hypothetical protein
VKHILAVVLVVAVASIALSQSPPSNPLANLNGGAGGGGGAQRWDYKISKRGGHTQQPEVWEKTLNDLAAEGWELDQINQDIFYIFRRPAQPKPAASPVLKSSVDPNK